MTREEAVAVLKGFMENPLFSDVHKAAFNIAIHDIKQRHDWDINNLILINKENYELLYTDEEIAKSFIEDVEAVKDLLPTTKNDLGVDAVSRQAVLELIADYDLSMGQVVRGIHALPSVTPQEPKTFKWCDTCKEYDQEKHCCHRWSKVIRDTVEEMKQEYIEREVLDGIYADIQRLRGCSCSCSDGIIDDVEDILDKYKAENNS